MHIKNRGALPVSKITRGDGKPSRRYPCYKKAVYLSLCLFGDVVLEVDGAPRILDGAGLWGEKMWRCRGRV